MAASRLVARDPSRVELLRLRCSEVVFDVPQPQVLQSSWPLAFFSKGWRDQRKWRLIDRLKTTRTTYDLRRADPKFDESAFFRSAVSTAQEFNARLALNQMETIGEICTETLAKCIQDHPPPRAELFSKPELSRQISLLEKPKILQMRPVQVSEKFTDISFVQATVRLVTENLPLTEEAFHNQGGATEKKSFERVAPKYGRKTRNDVLRMKNEEMNRKKVGNKLMMPQRWGVAFDEKKGEYFYNLTEDGVVRWKRPQNYFFFAVHPMPSRGVLGSTGLILDYYEDKGTFKMQTDFVFEKPLFNLDIPWRIHYF